MKNYILLFIKLMNRDFHWAKRYLSIKKYFGHYSHLALSYSSMKDWYNEVFSGLLFLFYYY